MKILRLLKAFCAVAVVGAVLSGCARTPRYVEINYQLYPVNEAATSIGTIQGRAISGTIASNFEFYLPSGEVVKGDATLVESDRFEFGGVMSETLGVGEPTSLAPGIYKSFLRRLRPDRKSYPVLATGFGDKGTRVECEGYWNPDRLDGLGGCRFSDESLFRYHAKGTYTQ